VVIDTMVVSALVNAARQPDSAAQYRSLIAARPALVSFATVTEMRYGVLKAGWGELRRRGLERDLARFIIVQPDDELMKACATLRAECEKAGHPLGQKIHEADRWIAATAIRLDVALVSDDTVFTEVPRLSVVSRSS
jgi:predicted nucleic acid-binding protein